LCCSDNTAEVGLIKLIKSSRISDGIVRLYYVAGEHALSLLNVQNTILDSLVSSWGVGEADILPTATRFFDGYKKYKDLVTKQNTQILDLTMKAFLLDPQSKLAAFESTENNATLFVGNMPHFAQVRDTTLHRRHTVLPPFFACLSPRTGHTLMICHTKISKLRL